MLSALPLAEDDICARDAEILPHPSMVTSFASASPTTVSVPVNESVVFFKYAVWAEELNAVTVVVSEALIAVLWACDDALSSAKELDADCDTIPSWYDIELSKWTLCTWADPDRSTIDAELYWYNVSLWLWAELDNNANLATLSVCADPLSNDLDA